LEVPFLVVKRADRSSLQPPGDAMEVEGVVANTPSSRALVLHIGDLIGLTVNARLHDMILANGTVVYVNIPGP